MPDTGACSDTADCLYWLRDESAGMFTEVQRADTKATTLCGVAGGLLTVDAAVLSGMPRSAWLSMAVLASAAVLLGIALIMAMAAIRPVLPRQRNLSVFVHPVNGHQRMGEDVPAASVTDAGSHVRAEAARLALFTALAQRKFQAVKWAVDFTAAALVLAGLGLLILYITT